MRRIKKKYTAYFIFAAVIAAAVFAANAALTGYPVLCGIISAAAAAGEALWTVYFISLKYSYGGGKILIESGIMFRKKRLIYEKSLLMTREISLFGKTAAVILYTAAGRTAMFCGEFLTFFT